MKRLNGSLFVCAGFVLLAAVFMHPLLAHFGSAFPGGPTEANDNPWNMWHFRWAIHHNHDNPFWTDLQYWPFGANLLLHHYTLFNDVIAFSLIPVLGLVKTHNLIFFASFVAMGLVVYRFLRDFGAPPLAAFAGGAYFLASPMEAAQFSNGRGMEFMSLWAPALFVWALCRAARDKTLRSAALAAGALTLAWTFNYYYFSSCALLIPLLWLIWAKPLSLSFTRAKGRPVLDWPANFLLAGAFVFVGRALFRGQHEFHGAGSARELIFYVLPYVLFWAALGIRLLLAFRPKLKLHAEAFGWKESSPFIGTCACWAALNWPLIGTVVYLMATGDYGVPAKSWRGGGNPVDLGLLLLPNPHHPLWGHALWDLIGGEPGAPSFGWVATALAVWLALKGKADRWTRAWLGALGVFAVLMLGPWLKAFGVHLYLPLPFYFLHLLPVISNFPNGIYFDALASILMALAVGWATKDIISRKGNKWALAVLAALLFEAGWGHAQLYRFEAPRLVADLRSNDEGGILPVPVSVMFHLNVPNGWWGKAFVNGMMANVANGRPIVGGTLSRTAGRTYEAYMGNPFFRGILASQEGAAPGFLLKDRKAMERFFKDWHLSFVIVDEELLPAPLKAAMKRWPMRRLDSDGPLVLYSTIPQPHGR